MRQSKRYGDALDASNPHREKYEPLARQAAQAHGVDPDVFTRMIMKESSFNPMANADNPGAAAFGIAQFTPETGAKYGLTQHSDFFNAEKALNASAKHISDLLKDSAVQGDYRKALSMYNSGNPNAYKNPGIQETWNYVRAILPGSVA